MECLVSHHPLRACVQVGAEWKQLLHGGEKTGRVDLGLQGAERAIENWIPEARRWWEAPSPQLTVILSLWTSLTKCNYKDEIVRILGQ
jgi:hypothetical protein